VSLIREVDRLRMEKLILSNPHSSSSVIREQDLNLAILRASVGTSAENDRWVEKLRFKLERGSLRPFMPSAVPKHTSPSDNGIRGLFSSFLLGAPMTMNTTMGWPMDIFITPPAMTSYIDINVYLTAIRDTHLKVLSCWSSLSASQRRRRRWTGSNEGGTRAEIEKRQHLARLSWGVVRAMLFFLDQLLGHFMVDIIDVQHRRLLDSLQEVNIAAKQGINSRPSSMRGSVARASSPGSRFGGTPTSAGRAFAARNWESESPNDSTHDGFDTQTIRTRAPPSSARPAHAVFLDFLTLR
jgi:gamma-tubulin complex component 4